MLEVVKRDSTSQATQFRTRLPRSWDLAVEFLGVFGKVVTNASFERVLYAETPEGTTAICDRDYIVRSPQGHFYVLSEIQFLEVYWVLNPSVEQFRQKLEFDKHHTINSDGVIRIPGKYPWKPKEEFMKDETPFKNITIDLETLKSNVIEDEYKKIRKEMDNMIVQGVLNDVSSRCKYQGMYTNPGTCPLCGEYHA
ncbi:MAG: hypothetical protein RR643_04920 [Anaerorhabdus sp.]|uniref:hypothetical protein n=1 Tax=Anaerorhabdus sp. TaxID=1872524 RepID=UPI002FCB92FE